ncbi:pantothenate kinase 2 [Quillaja saponaria]|uniref:Pantothenate kinase 2 n=1 Tax=Quillaja saponaria TaxID=32244 RepID=A0AAD7LUJ3_QUISA|nr:pantothenate kinase 2 [Quillaja saponaria]
MLLSSKSVSQCSSTCCSDGTYQYAKIMATGGGSHKYEDLFKDRLGFTFHRVDELEGLVGGANFLLKNVHQEAFTYTDGRKEFIRADPVDLFPYLLVTIGSGVTWIKVTGEGKAEFYTGSTIGGSTMLGMARVLTKCKSYDHFLELSQQGDDSALNLTVGDIYGEMGNIKYNIPPSSVACRFGKLNRDGDISLHKVEDVAASLLSGFIYHIIHTSHLVAKNLGIKRIVFGGSFTIGHSSTMERYPMNFTKGHEGKCKQFSYAMRGF